MSAASTCARENPSRGGGVVQPVDLLVDQIGFAEEEGTFDNLHHTVELLSQRHPCRLAVRACFDRCRDQRMAPAGERGVLGDRVRSDDEAIGV